MRIMENKRFFAFGCSFTRYAWPTWADIIGQNFKDNYYNYGQHGAGNVFIFQMLNQADIKHKITKDDVVIIQWSSILREDRYIKFKWVTEGGILNSYPDDYIKKYFDTRGFLIRDLGLINAAKSFLDNIGCEYHFLSMCEIGPPKDSLDDTAFQLGDSDKDVMDFYKDVIDIIKPSFYQIVGFDNRPLLIRDNVYLHDSHRLPSEHLKYIEIVLPKFLPNDTRFVDEMDEMVRNTYREKSGCWKSYDWLDIDRGLDKVFRL